MQIGIVLEQLVVSCKRLRQLVREQVAAFFVIYKDCIGGWRWARGERWFGHGIRRVVGVIELLLMECVCFDDCGFFPFEVVQCR